MKNFKRFLHTTKDVFKIYWEIAPGLTIGVLVTQVLLQLQGLLNAYILGIFIDQILKIIANTKNITQILPIIVIYVLISWTFDVINILNNYFNSTLSIIDIPKIRLKHTDLMIELGISQMENPSLTNKSTRFTEVYASMNHHLQLLIGLISAIFSMVTYGVVVYSFAPVIVFAILVFFIFKFLNNSRFVNGLWKIHLDSTEERRKAYTSINYLADPTYLKEILSSSGISLLRNKFTDFINWYNKGYRKIRSKWAVFENLHVLIDALLYGTGILLLIQKVLFKNISIGTFTFYLRSLGSFSDQLTSLSYSIASTMDSSIRLQDALELFELYKPEKDGEQILAIDKKPPIIEMKNITFTYPNGKKPVIENLNFRFFSGEKIAIVGANGAGKTTLVKLLTRIYRPQIGEITLNDININELKKESLYKKFGVLFQDFNSYGNLTVTENVQIGKSSKKVDLELIKNALKKADAMSFVQEYPKYLDQVLSERYKDGIRPSGGQWQKIAIARLFYRNAPILILDEPTASIDAVSESRIFDNVYKFMNGKTVIIISHRFSTVRNADRILVIDKGKIIEEGTHEQLMKKDGKYAHAFRLQAKGYK